MKCFPEYDFPGNGRSRMSIAHQNLRVSIKTSQGDTLKFFDVLVGRSSGKTLLDFFFLTDHQSSDPYEIEEKCDQDFFLTSLSQLKEKSQSLVRQPFLHRKVQVRNVQHNFRTLCDPTFLKFEEPRY